METSPTNLSLELYYATSVEKTLTEVTTPRALRLRVFIDAIFLVTKSLDAGELDFLPSSNDEPFYWFARCRLHLRHAQMAVPDLCMSVYKYVRRLCYALLTVVYESKSWPTPRRHLIALANSLSTTAPVEGGVHYTNCV